MDKKKLAIIGSDHIAAIELVYSDLLKKNDFQVLLFPAQSLFFKYYYHSFYNKLFYRLGLSNIINTIQSELRNFIEDFSPQFVIVFKGMEITSESLFWIKNKGIKVFNYNPDHPFIFSGKGSGNSNVKESISIFDCYFSYADDVVDQLLKNGIKSEKIPFGFDGEGFIYSELQKSDEIEKTCFLGNADKFRVKFLNKLAESGLEIDVYGENWKQFKLSKLITVGPAKYGQDFWIILQKYAVQLNLLRPHNFNSHNMRSFDIPGSGGIMLAPLTNDHLTYFTEDKHVFLYDSFESAFYKANHILNLSFNDRMCIRKNAREHSFKYHTYTNRINLLIKHLEI